jgi:hypothetical protein
MTTITSTQAAATEPRPTIHFLDDSRPEWHRAWAEIERRYGDTTCECPVTGEVWHYMGTVERAGRFEHQFRHRNLLVRNARVYDQVAASHGWRPEVDG